MSALVVQRGESSEEVWDAAVCTLLHLCCQDGGVLAEGVVGLSPAAMGALLHRSLDYHW